MTCEVFSLRERLLRIGTDRMNPPSVAISITRRIEPLGLMVSTMYRWRYAI